MSTRLAMTAALMAVTATAWASSADEIDTVQFYGYAYDLRSDRYLYTELHEQRLANGRWLGGSITYFAPDGSRMGHKTLDFSSDPYVPEYRLELAYSGYEEGIRIHGDEVEMYKRDSRDSPEQIKRVPRAEAMAADSGFHAFLRDHLQQLMQGETLRFEFAVAGNQAVYTFRARQVGESTFEERPAVQLRVQLASLLRLVAPDLELLYDPDEGRLLEYRGVSNVHDPDTGKAYNARIAYYSEPPPEAREVVAGLNKDACSDVMPC